MTGQIKAKAVRPNPRPSVQIQFPAKQSISTALPARGWVEPRQESGWFQQNFATAVSSRWLVYCAPECHQMFGPVRRIRDSRLATDRSNPPLCWETSSSVATSHSGFAKNTLLQQSRKIRQADAILSSWIQDTGRRLRNKRPVRIVILPTEQGVCRCWVSAGCFSSWNKRPVSNRPSTHYLRNLLCRANSTTLILHLIRHSVDKTSQRTHSLS